MSYKQIDKASHEPNGSMEALLMWLQNFPAITLQCELPTLGKV